MTGGNSGIGRAIAERFAAEGVHVVVASRRAAGAGSVRCDVSNEAQVRALVRGVIRRHGRVDILVNNAGIGGAWDRIERVKRRDWDRVMATNLTGAMLCAREVFPHMKKRRRGEIIMISSVCGQDAWEGSGAYSASKHGMQALAKALLDEGLPHGIRTACICPGQVATPMGGRGRTLIRPEDVAAAAWYLATLGPNVVVREIRLDRRAALVD